MDMFPHKTKSNLKNMQNLSFKWDIFLSVYHSLCKGKYVFINQEGQDVLEDRSEFGGPSNKLKKNENHCIKL